ncbi:hypothetical protein TRIP_C21169 [Candidatus Zixiibacteriota bacterium]|nr:hypothetical protein TRIP_C21169 [candidate division Zixibacteria bacterium]
MKNFMVVILILSLAGNLIGAYFIYKALKLRGEIRQYQNYHADLKAKYESLKADFGGIAVYKAENERLLKETSPEQRKKMTILFGASITKGFDAEKYLPGKGLINRGIGSQSDTQLLARFSPDVLRLEPGNVVLKFCSGNFTPKADIQAIWDEYELMAMEAAGHNIKPILATVLPATKSAEEYPDYSIAAQVKDFNSRVRELGAKHGFIIADYYEALSDKDGYLPDSLARDSIHPNEKGYAIMANVLGPILD